MVWFFDFPVVAASYEPALAQDGTHYAVNWLDALYAIDPFGLEQWHVNLDEVVGVPDLDPTDSILILNTQRTQTHPAALKAVSATNGSDLWRMEFLPDETGLDQYINTGAAFSANGDTAYVITAIASSDRGKLRTYLNAIDTDPSIPNASTVLRSVDVTLNVRSSRRKVNFTGIVSVWDENKKPISGATVSATWTMPDGTTRTTGDHHRRQRRGQVSHFGSRRSLQVRHHGHVQGRLYLRSAT